MKFLDGPWAKKVAFQMVSGPQRDLMHRLRATFLDPGGQFKVFSQLLCGSSMNCLKSLTIGRAQSCQILAERFPVKVQEAKTTEIGTAAFHPRVPLVISASKRALKWFESRDVYVTWEDCEQRSAKCASADASSMVGDVHRISKNGKIKTQVEMSRMGRAMFVPRLDLRVSRVFEVGAAELVQTHDVVASGVWSCLDE